MSIVKSLSVGDGDMFYIKHTSDNFTVIDCNTSEDNADAILKELTSESKGKGVTRFISTHPDDDHIGGLVGLHEQMNLLNFYCVKNESTKEERTDDFEQYCELRDDIKKAFYLYRGCSRKWMNQDSEERGSSGLRCLWPITDNADYKDALAEAKEGASPNNISPIVKYSLSGGAEILWMGDLETDFMEKIEDEISMDRAHILFAPHHGRDSGRVPAKWLDEMSPKLIIIGEAPSEHLNYYEGYDTITQNSAGDITLECLEGKTRIYVSDPYYSVDFLEQERVANSYGGYYIGTLTTKS